MDGLLSGVRQIIINNTGMKEMYVLVSVMGVIGDTENEYEISWHETEESARNEQSRLIRERDEAGYDSPGYRVYPVDED